MMVNKIAAISKAIHLACFGKAYTYLMSCTFVLTSIFVPVSPLYKSKSAQKGKVFSGY